VRPRLNASYFNHSRADAYPAESGEFSDATT
jgi:hypothetical protein